MLDEFLDGFIYPIYKNLTSEILERNLIAQQIVNLISESLDIFSLSNLPYSGSNQAILRKIYERSSGNSSSMMELSLSLFFIWIEILVFLQ